MLTYALTALLLVISFMKDRQKTKKALMKAWKSFENILPEFMTVLLLVGLMLAILNPETITQIIGQDSGILGVLLAGIVGAITLIPGFVAFPMASMLMAGGAGTTQIAMFVSTLMMVGIMTLPIEIKYFGKRMSFLRNGLAFLISLPTAYIIGWVVSL